MKILHTEEIDNIKIVVQILPAFGLIDNEATKKIINEKIKQSTEFKNIEEKKSQIKTFTIQAMQAAKNSKSATTITDKQKYDEEYKLRRSQIDEISKNLVPLAEAFNKKWTSLIEENAIYFTPAKNNELISDTEAEKIQTKLIEAINSGNLIDHDLKIIPDYRGKVFYKKISNRWEKTEITKIGIDKPSGYILYTDLSENQISEISEQNNTDRIQSLTSDNRIAEKTKMIESAGLQAVSMRNVLEIQGDKKALEKSQDWYNLEIEKINKIYG
jgi:hypothetical protein